MNQTKQNSASESGGADVLRLQEAFELLTSTTQAMEESYRRLENRVKELDRALAAKNQELALTSDYLNGLLESMSDGVIAINTDGIVTTFNRAACHVLAYDAVEVLGKTFGEVFRREFSVPPGWHAMELRAKDGRPVPVTERDAPMSDRANHRIGAVKVFQDLSEIEALREQVRRKDRLAALGEMAATVAHEIRNPLGGVRGFAALLARDLEPGDPRARLVERILTGTKNLDDVVSGLLEYTRPVELRLRATPCADLVDAAIGYIDCGRRAIALTNTISPDLAVLADPDKMRQVFLNIILNAVQSIEEKGEIWIAAEPDSQHVNIMVSDTGCGISRDQVSRVFSPFFTTKEKGTGLGLAVAAKIVEGHGGTIRVQSDEGKGSVFSLSLPRVE